MYIILIPMILRVKISVRFLALSCYIIVFTLGATQVVREAS